MMDSIKVEYIEQIERTNLLSYSLGDNPRGA